MKEQDAEEPGTAAARTVTGVPGLDSLLDGGFPANRSILVCGAPGTGKTLLGLQFLGEGLNRGEAGVFVCVDQKPRHLIEDAAAFGWNLQAQASRTTLAVLDASPYFTSTNARSWQRSGLDARQVASDLIQQVSTVKARRLVIDTITSLVPHDMERGHAQNYLRSLIQSLEDNLGCTVVLTCRALPGEDQGSCEAARYLVSGVIELSLRERGDTMQRMLTIHKMRRTPIEPSHYAFVVEPHRGLALAAAETSLDDANETALPFASVAAPSRAVDPTAPFAAVARRR